MPPTTRAPAPSRNTAATIPPYRETQSYVRRIVSVTEVQMGPRKLILQDRRADRRARSAALLGQEARRHLRSGDEPVVDLPRRAASSRDGSMSARPPTVTSASARSPASSSSSGRAPISALTASGQYRRPASRAIAIRPCRPAAAPGTPRAEVRSSKAWATASSRATSGAWRWWSKRREAYQSDVGDFLVEAAPGLEARQVGGAADQRAGVVHQRSRDQVSRSSGSRPTKWPSCRAQAATRRLWAATAGRRRSRFRAACPANRPAPCALPTSIGR